MKPRIGVLTLAVDDLERAVAFYRDGLGLGTKGIVGTEYEHGAVAFFELRGGLRLALWPRASLAHDTGLAPTPATIDDALFAELRAAFSDAQIVELASALAWENYRARFNRVFAVESEDFSHGAFCPIPDHAAS